MKIQTKIQTNYYCTIAGNNNNDGLPKSPSNTSLHLPTNNHQQSASTGQLPTSNDSNAALQTSTSDLQHKVCKLVD